MELWIRSQNKLSLTKVNNVDIDYNDQKKIIANYMEFNGGEDYTPLGEYDTEERALEVLDEIQNVLKPITVFKNAEINKEAWEEIQKVGVCAINDRADVIKLDTFVYEMPKE